jgi:putative AlgH/UPF0301 family transcriptional regulator
VAEEEEEDWRQFRAKLVGRTYFEVGQIEQGSIVLSTTTNNQNDDEEDPIACHGDLNQPYFHKAVILITDHQPQVFTKGILLNRPTQLELFDSDIVFVEEDEEDEEENNNNSLHFVDLSNMATENNSTSNNNNNNNTPWTLHFGGDIADVYDEETEITCLHSIRSPLAKNLSETILPDLYATSYLGARRLLEAGEATRQDFVAFHGFCGWDPGQLQMEILEQSSWITVATDAKTIWNDLQELSKEPLQASGVSMWKAWQQRLGKIDDNDDMDEEENSFSDLMLKEWTAAMLEIAREDILTNQSLSNETGTTTHKSKYNNEKVATVEPGMLLRASARNPSPFLLQEQYLHKSMVLIVKETEELSLGVILNLPSTNTFLLETPSGKMVEFPVRFGGTNGVMDEDAASNDDENEEDDSLLWFHCSKGLKKLGIGSPVNDTGSGTIWVCDVDQVADAIERGHALPSEFLVTQGFVCWDKQEDGTGGIGDHILEQNFEVISPFQIENTWSLLQSQTRLSERTLEANFNSGMNAWKVSRVERNGKRHSQTENEKEDDDHFIYESNVKVSELADEALRHWISVYLIGDPED